MGEGREESATRIRTSIARQLGAPDNRLKTSVAIATRTESWLELTAAGFGAPPVQADSINVIGRQRTRLKVRTPSSCKGRGRLAIADLAIFTSLLARLFEDGFCAVAWTCDSGAARQQ